MALSKSKMRTYAVNFGSAYRYPHALSNATERAMCFLPSPLSYERFALDSDALIAFR